MLQFVTVEPELLVVESPKLNPWLTVWFSPRVTIRRILDSEVRPSWIPVVALAVLHQGFASLQLDPVDGAVSIGRSVMPVIIGSLQMVFGVLIGPFLLAFVGNWLGGEADAEEIRHTVAWSYVPFATVAVGWLAVRIAYGGIPQVPADEASAPWGLVLVGIATLIAVCWGLVLEVIMLAETQRFSIWRAAVNIFVFIVPMLLLAAIR